MRQLYAHDWKILNGDRIPRWPDEDDARGITVRISSWVGTSAIGAIHYYANVEEEKNQWWCEKESCWAELSCDSGNRGHNLRAECLSRTEAENAAKEFVELIKRASPNQPYRVLWNCQDEEDYFNPGDEDED